MRKRASARKGQAIVLAFPTAPSLAASPARREGRTVLPAGEDSETPGNLKARQTFPVRFGNAFAKKAICSTQLKTPPAIVRKTNFSAICKANGKIRVRIGAVERSRY